jgi:hypothetical protein
VTVQELKEALRGVPDEVNVIILVDGYESESKEPWLARHITDEDEDGTVTEEFRINC